MRILAASLGLALLSGILPSSASAQTDPLEHDLSLLKAAAYATATLASARAPSSAKVQNAMMVFYDRMKRLDADIRLYPQFIPLHADVMRTVGADMMELARVNNAPPPPNWDHKPQYALLAEMITKIGDDCGY